MRKLCGIAAGIFAVVACESVRAEQVTFNFAGNLALREHFDFTDASGLSLRVTGANTKPNRPTTSALVSRTSHGFGILGFPIGNPLGMDHLLSTESMIFDFLPGSVVLNKMEFHFIDEWKDNDEVRLQIQSSGVNSIFDISTQGTSVVNFDFTNELTQAQRTGMRFIASTTDFNDDYTIAGITVDFTPARSIEPVPVPLPSTAYGGLALLAGCGAVRWWRRRTA